MSPLFERCMEFLLRPDIEGGYSNDPDDPGGETKYGISKRSYPDEDIKNLTVERAKAIYHRDYWLVCRGDDLPPALAFLTFDASVNMGSLKASKNLQSAIGTLPDGVIGDRTVATAKVAGDRVINEMVARRAFDYAKIGSEKYLLGWYRRLAKAHEFALALKGMK